MTDDLVTRVTALANGVPRGPESFASRQSRRIEFALMLRREKREGAPSPSSSPSAPDRDIASGREIPSRSAAMERPSSGKSFGPASDDPAIRKAWLRGFEIGWRQFHGRRLP